MDGTFHSLRRGSLRALLVLTAFCLLTSCNGFSSGAGKNLAQGWSGAERSFFYYTTQGSRLVRRDWFLALERDDSQDLFLTDGLKRFGYLPGSADSLNPDKLPIGFAVDTPTSREWIGMTCAACHTSDITFRGTTMRVDGAPASADMYAFLSKLDLALQKAANDDAAFLRFAKQVLGANDTPANRAVLRDDVSPEKGIRAFSGKFKQFVIDSTPTAPLQWGPARLDAFGMIFNRVTSIDLGIPGNSRHPNAPVSYPFLWGTSWHDVTQWNGAVPNDSGKILGPIHRLARNVGQVLGVFGQIDLTHGPKYSSSAQIDNLKALEDGVSKLTAPEWPAAFGVPDPALVAKGAELYSKTHHCADCHVLVPKNDQYRFAEAKKVPASVTGTDPAMTTVPAVRRADSGVLQGRPLDPLPLNRPTRPIGPNELVADLLAHVVSGVVSPFVLPGTPANQVKPLFDASVFARNYKARPLNGIWATGPYLHNGSVRTLYQLLLPPAQRQAKFQVGSREFDPVQVGFADAPGVIPFQLDTTIDGNHNSGHVFGTGMSDDDRKALVEYLKTL